MAQKITIRLKDKDSKIVQEIYPDQPLPFPYLFYNGRLYVSSRDNPCDMLERSYLVLNLQQQAPAKKQEQEEVAH